MKTKQRYQVFPVYSRRPATSDGPVRESFAIKDNESKNKQDPFLKVIYASEKDAIDEATRLNNSN